MKIVAKIFNWITIIFCAVSFVLVVAGIIILGILAKYSNEMLTVFYLAVLLFPTVIPTLIPIIVCAISNRKLKKATCKKDILVIAIITLLVGNLISGICMLCMDEDDFIVNEE